MPADINSNLANWSTIAANNQPDDTDAIINIPPNFREIQAVVRKYLATKGADIASAATVNLANATGNYVHVTGTTTITSLGTVSAGLRYTIVFNGALTVTHNATSLILPTSANILTEAGDSAEFVSLGSGNWRCLWYQRSAGTVLYDDIASLSYTLGVTGAVASTAQRKLEESVSVTDFGATGDGVTDDTAAINIGIAAINAGTVKNLYFPGGNYLVSAALTTLTASNWNIYGAGMGATTITMASGAGTTGTIFTIGNVSTTCARWGISGFDLIFNNYATLNGNGNPFVINYSSEGLLYRVRVNSGNGLVTLGSTSLGTMCSRQAILFCRANAYSPSGGKSVDIQSQAGLMMHGCTFGATGTAASAFRGMLVHPTATDTMDNMKVSSCEWNYPNSNVDYCIEFNLTNNTASTQTFNNCVFDQAIIANIYAHIDSGAIADARLSSSFAGCTSNGGTTGTICVLLDNTGGKEMSFRWSNGLLSTPSSGNAVKLTGGNKINAFIDSTAFVSRASASGGIPIIVDTGCSGLSVNGCYTDTSVSTATGLPFVNHTHLVEFVSTASNCIITGNNAKTCSSDLIKWTAIGTSNLETIIIKNNIAAKNKFPFTAATSDATPTTVYTFALADEKSYIINARVHAQNAAGSNRAYYEYKGLYYRDTGGGATLQGSVVTIAAIESDATWACNLVASSNNVQLNVTGASGVGIDWMFDIEVTENDK